MFQPNYKISPTLSSILMAIESVTGEVEHLPLGPRVRAALRETARLTSTHYSTMIEGNQLSQAQVQEVIQQTQHFPGRERDEQEVLGYYTALQYVEQLAKKKSKFTERIIQLIHALVMAGGKKKVKPTPYRDGQNVIRDSRTRRIVYLPPEATDVPVLMQDFVAWILSSFQEKLSGPVLAAIAHYQFATIHPYYDGNGRTARLLATLLLHKTGYGLKGLYCLEEYYAKDLTAYYQALTIGPSHNYYMGREDADITPWIEYFCLGMLDSFEHVKRQALRHLSNKKN